MSGTRARRWRVRWKPFDAVATTAWVFADYLSHADALRHAARLARSRPKLRVELRRAR